MRANRGELIAQLARKLSKLNVGHPLRVAVDGRTASGKTTFASELARSLKDIGCHVISTSIDGFHNPKIVRYQRGRFSGEGYYRDSRNLAAVKERLLGPLGPNGNLAYQTHIFDLAADKAIPGVVHQAPKGAVLIVDRTFLQRLELDGNWDVVIFLQTDEDMSETRGIARDCKALGGVAAATRLYVERYKPAYELYLKECSPEQSADVVVNNNDFETLTMNMRI